VLVRPENLGLKSVKRGFGRGVPACRFSELLLARPTQDLPPVVRPLSNQRFLGRRKPEDNVLLWSPGALGALPNLRDIDSETKWSERRVKRDRHIRYNVLLLYLAIFLRARPYVNTANTILTYRGELVGLCDKSRG
jgi:hypothetical protein